MSFRLFFEMTLEQLRGSRILKIEYLIECCNVKNWLATSYKWFVAEYRPLNSIIILPVSLILINSTKSKTIYHRIACPNVKWKSNCRTLSHRLSNNELNKKKNISFCCHLSSWHFLIGSHFQSCQHIHFNHVAKIGKRLCFFFDTHRIFGQSFI